MATASITRKTNHSHSAPSNPCSAERLDLLLLGLWGFALPCFSIPTSKEWIPADQHNPAFHTFLGNHIQREHLPLRSLFQGVSFTEHPKCPVLFVVISLLLLPITGGSIDGALQSTHSSPCLTGVTLNLQKKGTKMKLLKQHQPRFTELLLSNTNTASLSKHLQHRAKDTGEWKAPGCGQDKHYTDQ